jgi:hypothetical protein
MTMRPYDDPHAACNLHAAFSKSKKCHFERSREIFQLEGLSAPVETTILF